MCFIQLLMSQPQVWHDSLVYCSHLGSWHICFLFLPHLFLAHELFFWTTILPSVGGWDETGAAYCGMAALMPEINNYWIYVLQLRRAFST